MYSLDIKSIFILTFLTLCQGLMAQTVYVSPDGNDSNPGSSIAPLANIQAAQIKARKIKECNPDSTVTIELAPGTYHINRSLVFTPADSGISIRGSESGKSEINGGVRLPSFTEINPNLWAIDLSTVLPCGGEVGQFYVGGRHAVRARTPNEGHYFKGARAVDTPIQAKNIKEGVNIGYYGIRYIICPEAMEALSKVKEYPTQLKISIYHKWDLTQRNVWSISQADSCVYFNSTILKPWNRIDNCSQYMFEDDMSFLDYPGEYFYDTERRMLYYIPRPDDSLDTAAVIPSTETIFTFEGSIDNHVSDISVSNLSIACTRHTICWRGKETEQASYSSKAAVQADYADNIRFDNCELSQIGNNAIWFRTACRNCELTHCYLHNLGISAVKIGSYVKPSIGKEDLLLTRNITVDNNILRSGGLVDATGEAVTLFHASDCSITHNEISDFYYTGISVGWVWGYDYSPSKRNTIGWNHIHRIGKGLLSDMGGIYTLGASEGTVVVGNVIHDIYSLGYGGWGLYTDEGSSGILMTENYVYNCKSSGFHQHYGKDNKICNNIFLNSTLAQLEATRVEDHISFEFVSNIVAYQSGEMYGINWDKVNFISDRNIYWNYNGEVSFNGLTLEEWQKKTGKDKHSIIANPSSKAAMRKIGFVPFKWDCAGVYGDDEWKQLSNN